jgi:hypothetical protein
MDFTVENRRKMFKRFMDSLISGYEILGEKWSSYITLQKLFNMSKLTSGVEGTVYKAYFKNNISPFPYPLAVKKINLKALLKTKDVPKDILMLHPYDFYSLILSDKALNNPAFTEIIASTLVNQLVIQKICPNFSFNYYWDYEGKEMTTVTEFVQGVEFDTWAQQSHSEEMWYNIFFQILAGLVAMKRYFNMSHTDFHTGNILIQTVAPGGYWTYTIDGEKYYLPNLGFVCLIHDFGFAWIPEKMYIDWHYKDTLQHVTRGGREFYDVATFFKYILETEEYKVPDSFKTFITSAFDKHEITYIFEKDYYKENNPNFYKSYPEIELSYSGSGDTLEDKLFFCFNASSQFAHKQALNKPDNSFRLESYSLDKPFKKDKIAQNLRKLAK